ncbi:MAG: hypothetical protein AAGA11_11820, partial [Pseudomonadota bacterium]
MPMPTPFGKTAVYATLGPEGTNHDTVLRAWLSAADTAAKIALHDDLTDALAACAGGTADHVFLCAAHPAASRLVSEAQYKHGILLSHCFIAESQPLALLCRSDTVTLDTVALHPATRHYTDLAAFDSVFEVNSTVEAYRGMLDGRWPCALTAARFSGEPGARLISH